MIPPPDYFAQLYEYVKWADLLQFDATRSLSDEEYFKDRGWSFGNIHKIQLHELSAQSVWLDRFTRQQAIWLFDDPRMSGRRSIEPEWRVLHDRFSKFLATLTPQILAADVQFTSLKGDAFNVPQWQLLVHVCNHASHHRGQLNSMIKLAGGKPVSTDYARYVALLSGKT